jgi:hypothetical protein
MQAADSFICSPSAWLVSSSSSLSIHTMLAKDELAVDIDVDCARTNEPPAA